MKKKWLAMALSAVLTLGMAAPAFAGGEEISAHLRFGAGGTKYPLDKEASGKGWSYDGNLTLTLNNYSGPSIIFHSEDRDGCHLRIQLNGDNVITDYYFGGGVASTNCIQVEGRESGYIALQGDGTLSVPKFTSGSSVFVIRDGAKVTSGNPNVRNSTEATFYIEDGSELALYEHRHGGSTSWGKFFVNGGTFRLDNDDQETTWKDENLSISGGGKMEFIREAGREALFVMKDSELLGGAYTITDFDGKPLVVGATNDLGNGNAIYPGYEGMAGRPSASKVRVTGNDTPVPEPIGDKIISPSPTPDPTPNPNPDPAPNPDPEPTPTPDPDPLPEVEPSEDLSLSLRPGSADLRLGAALSLEAKVATASNAATNDLVASASNALEWGTTDGDLFSLVEAEGTSAEVRADRYVLGGRNEAEIFAWSEEYQILDTCKVKVLAPKLAATATAATLHRGETATVEPKITNVAEDLDVSYTFTSADPRIIRVDENGKLSMGGRYGSTKIVVEAFYNGEKIAETELSVSAARTASQSSGSSSDSDNDYEPVTTGKHPETRKASNVGESKPGSWTRNEKGWWFAFDDGTWPKAQWVQLDWNNAKNWYYFTPEGYVSSGWLQDGGYTYYLHGLSDGNFGYMYTGWHEINGIWYYFNAAEGLPMGAMLKNQTTPDGYQVGVDGAWVK